MTTKEIERLLRLARSLGCRRLSVSGFEAEWFELPQDKVPPVATRVIQVPLVGEPPSSAEVLAALGTGSAIPSDEDFMFMSAGGLLPSELRAEEAKRIKQMEEALPKKDPH